MDVPRGPALPTASAFTASGPTSSACCCTLPPACRSVRISTGCISGASPRYGLPPFGWAVIETRMALTYATVWIIALAAWQAGRPELIRSPRLVLAGACEGVDS